MSGSVYIWTKGKTHWDENWFLLTLIHLYHIDWYKWHHGKQWSHEWHCEPEADSPGFMQIYHQTKHDCKQRTNASTTISMIMWDMWPHSSFSVNANTFTATCQHKATAARARTYYNNTENKGVTQWKFVVWGNYNGFYLSRCTHRCSSRARR